MKEIIVFIAFLFCAAIGRAENVTEDRDSADVMTFMKRLYSTPINDIEGGKRFNGKFDPNRGCEILRSFFIPRLISRESSSSGCDLSGDSVWFFRFPSIDSYEIGFMEEKNRLPNYRVESIHFSRAGAVAKVTIPAESSGRWVVGKSVYFLIKTSQGWRISNILAYNEWPLNLKGEYSDCRESSIHYGFALPPKSPEDFEDLPPACREMELDDRRRNGWGR